MAYEDRSAERKAVSVFRTSAEEKARLRAEAAAAELTLQQLFELRLLGAAKPVPEAGRHKKYQRQQEELPLSKPA